MEFGLFIQAPAFAFDREGDPDYEHRSLMNDLDVAIAADRAGFKYLWASEHHFLDEYSHLSANSVVLGYLAHATERIHLGSGIFNPLPAVIHPAKLAETVTMLDHVSDGRFEFGTGRGAGSHEILGFLQELGMEDLSKTREIWDDVIAEFPKMWLQDTYEGYEGKYWSLPPRKILPKPFHRPHPPMWYACGSPTSYEMAGRKGLGVLGFSVDSIAGLEPVLNSYKKAVAAAEPIGAYVNDNVMITGVAVISEDAREAEQAACQPNMAYQRSQVFRYHDTFPHPPEIPHWPELVPAMTPEQVPLAQERGMIIGDPDHALAQCKRWEAAGCDQLVFGTGWQSKEATLEMIKLMGEHVIPKLDSDPVHRTTRQREAALGVTS
jgi:alkanesulfonate monooxygenase SsuD/methylene tetrahydromethanopterin reductase-like flavin-dependent oxidoreductase (luciferase family)